MSDAARQMEAQLALGQLLLETGAAAEAWDAFAAAARAGEARARNMLGRLAQQGWPGRAPDPALAARLYAQAAEEGCAWALFNLADLALNGTGIPCDPCRAVALYNRAAEAGITKAFNMLGLCHEEGLGLPRDLEKARDCFRAGAMAGDCWAAFNLGRLALAAGEETAAVVAMQAALRTGFAAFWPLLAEALAGQTAPALVAIAAQARARSARATAVQAARTGAG